MLGTLPLRRMTAEIFPVIDITVVIVVRDYPGLSPEEMERRIVITGKGGKVGGRRLKYGS